jgi:hypothetical protein
VHVGVVSTAVGTASPTLTVSVWHSYQRGGLLIELAGRRSRKATAKDQPPGPVLDAAFPRSLKRRARNIVLRERAGDTSAQDSYDH